MPCLEIRDDAMDAQDWKTMYLIVMGALCDAVEDCGSLTKSGIVERLIQAALEAEDYYINVSDAVLGVPEWRDGELVAELVAANRKARAAGQQG